MPLTRFKLKTIANHLSKNRTYYTWFHFPSEAVFWTFTRFPFPSRIRKKMYELWDRYRYWGSIETVSKITGRTIGEVIEVLRNFRDPYPRYVEKGVPYREFLYALTVLLDLKTVIETGVARGSSTYAFLSGLRETGGQLYSIDIDPDVGELVPPTLRRDWILLVGDSKRILPKLLEDIGDIDAFMHDSVHTPEWMFWEYQTAWPHVSKLLLSDDAHQNNAFPTFAKKVGRKPHYIYNRLGVILR